MLDFDGFAKSRGVTVNDLGISDEDFLINCFDQDNFLKPPGEAPRAVYEPPTTNVNRWRLNLREIPQVRPEDRVPGPDRDRLRRFLAKCKETAAKRKVAPELSFFDDVCNVLDDIHAKIKAKAVTYKQVCWMLAIISQYTLNAFVEMGQARRTPSAFISYLQGHLNELGDRLPGFQVSDDKRLPKVRRYFRINTLSKFVIECKHFWRKNVELDGFEYSTPRLATYAEYDAECADDRLSDVFGTSCFAQSVLYSALRVAQSNDYSSPRLFGCCIAAYMKNCLDRRTTMDPVILAFMVFLTMTTHGWNTSFKEFSKSKADTPTTPLFHAQARAKNLVRSIKTTLVYLVANAGRCPPTLDSRFEAGWSTLEAFHQMSSPDIYENSMLTNAFIEVALDVQGLLQVQPFFNVGTRITSTLLKYNAARERGRTNEIEELERATHVLSKQLYSGPRPRGECAAAYEKWLREEQSNPGKRVYDSQDTLVKLYTPDANGYCHFYARLLCYVLKQDDEEKAFKQWEWLAENQQRRHKSRVQLLIDMFEVTSRREFAGPYAIMETDLFMVFRDCMDFGQKGLMKPVR